MKIKKCIIPIAGRGTRRLPITKTVSKEMLPVLNKPNIMLLVEECLLSGIEEIIFVVNKRNYHLIQDFFTQNFELKEFLKNSSQRDLLNDLDNIIKNVKFNFVYQDENIRGTAGAIYAARSLIENEFFAVMFGDDLIDSKEPFLKELMIECEKHWCNVIGVKEVEEHHKHYYYLIKYKDNNIMESFAKTNEDKVIASNHMMIGRMVLNSTILDKILDTQCHDENEYYLPDVLEILNEDIRTVKCTKNYYNIGNILGYLKANIAYGLKNDKIRDELLNFMREKVEEERK